MSDLPPPPIPRGNYLPAVTRDGVVYVSGQVSRDADGRTVQGHLKFGCDITQARHAAELATLRCLSALDREAGGLDQVSQILMVRGYICSDHTFDAHSQVIDAASDLLVARLGERGRHARVALGVSSIPTGGLVEIEMIAAVRR